VARVRPGFAIPAKNHVERTCSYHGNFRYFIRPWTILATIQNHQFFSGVYKLTLTLPKLGISKEVLATQVIPFLFPLTVENSLTLKQFGMLIGLLKDMTARVESEQKEKLEQIGGLKKEQAAASMSMILPPGQLVSAAPPQSELDSFFSSLGIESSVESKPTPAAATPTSVTPSASSGSLSLEDKQRCGFHVFFSGAEFFYCIRLARQQEESRKKSSSNGHATRSLVTSPTTSTPAPRQSSSLMDGFLENNLKQIGLPQQRMPMQQPMQNIQSPTQVQLNI
jgi:hypothetical protein